MRRKPLIALLLVAGALLVAGCGGGKEVGATPETVVGELPEATAPGDDLPALALKGDAAAGKSVYTSSGCGSCHTLAAAGTSGNIGPNLDDAKPTTELIVTRVTKGQGGMPPFGEQLDPQQIADLAAYIVQSTGG